MNEGKENQQKINLFDDFVYKVSEFAHKIDKDIQEMDKKQEETLNWLIKEILNKNWVKTEPTPTQYLKAWLELWYDLTLVWSIQKRMQKTNLSDNPYYKKWIKSKKANKPTN